MFIALSTLSETKVSHEGLQRPDALKKCCPIILRASDVKKQDQGISSGDVVPKGRGRAHSYRARRQHLWPWGALEAFSGEVEGGAIVIPEGNRSRGG
jgi:hypothetical protein